MVQKRQEETARRLQVTREDIVMGLLASIQLAREQGDAGTMIRGAAELSKLLGFYPEKGKGKAGTADTASQRPLEELSDEELTAMLNFSET
jgi:hypothetical protein